ncbi:ligand-binding sensor domain-containing protein [Sphingobacterium hungaricum]|uniref:Histidine kinase n=1 Tax=Sphingobacterium hungaricum TaxID=2082723 RepID=A0A928UTQ6_9SPHI|nr:two-component regulator propeller domain-containing protein [Sphingobacterium hungaricum]MBE8713176.1 histidine kinase [Sphingobacterium hungaricum]
MIRYMNSFAVFLIIAFSSACVQHSAEQKSSIIKNETEKVDTSNVPQGIVRNIIQDRKGNIWIAAFRGMYKYDGKSFVNITGDKISGRFFSALEDKKGNFWFSSIGSGAYYYDGKSFTNFTTKEGLLNDEVGSIYEDQKGNIWFGVSGGASYYDGKSFRNYILDGNTMIEDRTGKTFSTRKPNGVVSIIEDRKGGMWFGAFDGVHRYDGKSFTMFTNNGKPFKNVRSIIEDSKGNIWIAGDTGLWRNSGGVLTNFTRQFVGYVYEDKHGNIWTSSESEKEYEAGGLEKKSDQLSWKLSRYHEESLMDANMQGEVIRENERMIFGILEATDGNIWFGTLDGVFSYNGKTFTDFKNKVVSD